MCMYVRMNACVCVCEEILLWIYMRKQVRNNNDRSCSTAFSWHLQTSAHTHARIYIF